MTESVTNNSKSSAKGILLKIVRNQLFIPLAALLLLVLFNLFTDPGFFDIVLKPSSTGSLILSGNLITIIGRMEIHFWH